MQKVISVQESSRLDQESADPVEQLMDRAGYGVALAAARMGIGYGSKVTVLAGAGNNGGDGYVAARWLARRGAAVTVYALAPPKTEAAAAARGKLSRSVNVTDLARPTDESDLVIDALFGSGFHGDLPDAAKAWLEVSAPVLAVDVPSGLDASDGSIGDVAFRAERTVTFYALKPGHVVGAGPGHCGAVSVHDIGLVGGDAEFLICEDNDAVLPARDRHAHKWSVGAVLVVGGVAGMTGAALLAARSALHSGAGAVAIASLESVQQWYATTDPGLLTHAISGNRHGPRQAHDVMQLAERYDALVLGPGLGRGVEGFVGELLDAWPGLLVLDADGLNAVATPSALARRTGETVLTPHAGEFARLTGQSATYPAAKTLAQETGATVVLKGNPTFVAGEQLWAVTSGGPELATIGTGDVLAGAIAAAAARGLDPETASRTAAHRHGRAGAWLSARTTVTASGLVEAMGVWMR